MVMLGRQCRAWATHVVELGAVGVRLRDRTPTAITELHARAETVRGLTGNYRLDAAALHEYMVDCGYPVPSRH